MIRFDGVWLVTSAQMRDMCELARTHGTDEALLSLAMQSEVRREVKAWTSHSAMSSGSTRGSQATLN